jgi:NADH-quinone oxidoreductase subunit F
LESLEGKRGQPRLRPPFPAVVGLYGQPTVINNTETMANVPYILNNGAEAYKKLGTDKSPGTKVFCLSGMVKRPGNYEAELGKITFRDLIYGEAFGQGMMTEGRSVKAILPSGASGPIVTEKALDVPLDYESVAAAGSILGSASVIVMDDSIDMVWAAGKVMHFFRHESCGKCTPCREGTFWMEKQYNRILSGRATLSDVQLLQEVANQMIGKCLCPLGEFATSPVLSSYKHFQAEYEGRATDAKKPAAKPAVAAKPAAAAKVPVKK